MSMNLYNPDTGKLIQVAGNGTIVVPMPVGTVVQFAGEEIPDGWLLCDGSEYSKLEYPALYAIIKDKWGTVSADKFRVPNYRDESNRTHIICAVKMDIAGNPEPKYNIGQVSHFLFQPDDPHWLLCDGSTVDADLHPVLASKIPVLPDLRECVLVGAGQNETLTIAEHDVYELGEFKDDQLQGHEHEQQYPLFNQPMDSGGYHAAIGGAIKFKTKGIVSDDTNGDPRVGTTTHGKQYGVGIYVYAD